MKVEAIDRRRHSRGGLFAEIEDATYRVLRRTAENAGEAEGDGLAEFAGDATIPDVNVTFGLPVCEQLGEPF